MLNKKAQFMENVDLIAGILLVVLGVIIFSLFSATTIDKGQEELEINLDEFEQNNHTIDLINLVSDPEILTLLTDFDNKNSEYLEQEKIRMDDIAVIWVCNEDFYERFRELIPSDSFFFMASKGDDHFFECYHDIGKDRKISQIITIPSTDPNQPITVRLSMQDE
jgi:hypothetical protein